MKYKVIKINTNSKFYPERLRNLDLLNYNFNIAIIGSRDYSEYGKKVCKEFSYNLAKRDICIISGLAKGIDSFAHSSCLDAKGKTIAVLGSGLNIIYPKENIKLFNEIISNNGLIISEYDLDVPPRKQNFQARNRIISGLSDGVLVIEAKRKSGTNITVDFALEQGKDVFVVPGNIYSKTSDGTNFLIKEGAIPVTSYEDITENF